LDPRNAGYWQGGQPEEEDLDWGDGDIEGIKNYIGSDADMIKKWDMLREDSAFVDAAKAFMQARKSGNTKAAIAAMMKLKQSARPTIDKFNSLKTGGTGNPAPRSSQSWPRPTSRLGSSAGNSQGFFGDGDRSQVDEAAAKREQMPGQQTEVQGPGNAASALGFGKGGASTGQDEVKKRIRRGKIDSTAADNRGGPGGSAKEARWIGKTDIARKAASGMPAHLLDPNYKPGSRR